jgi:uncharacterized protein YigE (DUF2233 family)
MKRLSVNRFRIVLVALALLFILAAGRTQTTDSKFLTFVTDGSKVRLYWQDEDGRPLRSLQNLKSFVERDGEKLRFAMNGGMYRPDNSPQGLYIESGVRFNALDTLSGSGNFYLKPNGVFYLTKSGQADVCETKHYVTSDSVYFATQSGPMLVIDGEMHSAFRKGSANLNIRNGVGILPGNKVVFVMSKQQINFYDFAAYFKQLGCRNALYLDGFVSRAYLPEEKWEQVDGNFGVMIGVVN